MDLYLMDAILKGHLPDDGKVLDIGCGEGRNGIYFIKNAYEYHGIDQDESKIKLLEYLLRLYPSTNTHLSVGKLLETDFGERSDVIIASRILHFAGNESEFFSLWKKLITNLKKNGIVYIAMDSAMVEGVAEEQANGKFEFEDGRVSFALTPHLYEKMTSNLMEVEPLRTVVYQNRRAQSFAILRRP